MFNKFRYELIYNNKTYVDTTLYFKTYDEIYNFVISDIFKNNCNYIVSCYDYKQHKFIYVLGGIYG